MDLLKILDDRPYTIEQKIQDCVKQEYIKGNLFKKARYKETIQGLWSVLTIYVNGQETLIQGKHLFKCFSPQYNDARYTISVDGVTQPISERTAKEIYEQIQKLHEAQETAKAASQLQKEKDLVAEAVQQKLNHIK